MLEKIIEILKTAEGPLTLKELSREMNIDPQALRGMLEYLDRKGRLTFRSNTCSKASPGSCNDCLLGCSIEKKR
ncbi:MAG: HTH domain-containing protein [Actinobacteria bacterium]|nr:HTH domain-containing protein [Actinomycetota bacterium]